MRSNMTGPGRAIRFALLAAALIPWLAHAQYGLDEPQASLGAGFSLDVPPGQGPPQGEVSLATFRSALAPYGSWVDFPGHGPVWRPAVAAGWRPYLHGRWVWTDAGWYWVSDEPWGWGPYHYGRWGYDSVGWYWAPGYEWAPAWVDWRYSATVVGWAPLAPAWWVTASVFYPAWTFMPCTRFAGYPANGWAYPATYYPAFHGQTRAAPPQRSPHAPGLPGWGGPPRPFVEGRMGRHIPAAPVRPGPVAGTPSRHGQVPAAGPRQGGQHPGAPRWTSGPAGAPRGGGGSGGSARTVGIPARAPQGNGAREGAPRWGGAAGGAPRTAGASPTAPRWNGGAPGAPRGIGAPAASPRPSANPAARPAWPASAAGAAPRYRAPAAPGPSAARTYASVPASRPAAPGWTGGSSGGRGGSRAMAPASPAAGRGSAGTAHVAGRSVGLAQAGGRHR